MFNDANDYLRDEDADFEATYPGSTQISIENFEALINENILEIFDACIIANFRADKTESLLSKIEWLQTPLLNLEVWPESNGTGWHFDFLELMWKIIEVSEKLRERPDEASEIFRRLLTNFKVWERPIGPTAILAIDDVDEIDVNGILQTFNSLWIESNGEFTFDKSKGISLSSDSLPLISIACLSPKIYLEQIRKLINIFVNISSQEALTPTYLTDIEVNQSAIDEIILPFWQYLIACLVSDREDENGSWWSPQPE